MGCGASSSGASTAIKPNDRLYRVEQQLKAEIENRRNAEKMLLETRNKALMERREVEKMMEEMQKTLSIMQTNANGSSATETPINGISPRIGTPRGGVRGTNVILSAKAGGGGGGGGGMTPLSNTTNNNGGGSGGGDVNKALQAVERLQVRVEDLSYSLQLQSAKEEQAINVIAILQKHIKALENSLVQMNPSVELPEFTAISDTSFFAEAPAGSQESISELRQKMRMLEDRLIKQSKEAEDTVDNLQKQLHAVQIENAMIRETVVMSAGGGGGGGGFSTNRSNNNYDQLSSKDEKHSNENGKVMTLKQQQQQVAPLSISSNVVVDVDVDEFNRDEAPTRQLVRNADEQGHREHSADDDDDDDDGDNEDSAAAAEAEGESEIVVQPSATSTSAERPTPPRQEDTSDRLDFEEPTPLTPALPATGGQEEIGAVVVKKKDFDNVDDDFAEPVSSIRKKEEEEEGDTTGVENEATEPQEDDNQKNGLILPQENIDSNNNNVRHDKRLVISEVVDEERPSPPPSAGVMHAARPRLPLTALPAVKTTTEGEDKPAVHPQSHPNMLKDRKGSLSQIMSTADMVEDTPSPFPDSVRKGGDGKAISNSEAIDAAFGSEDDSASNKTPSMNNQISVVAFDKPIASDVSSPLTPGDDDEELDMLQGMVANLPAATESDAPPPAPAPAPISRPPPPPMMRTASFALHEEDPDDD